MYKTLEEKIKTFEHKNFGEVSTEYDLTSEKIKSMFEKYVSQNHPDSSKMFDFIRTELLELIQMRKQYCKDKKEEIKAQRSQKKGTVGGIFKIGASSAAPSRTDAASVVSASQKQQIQAFVSEDETGPASQASLKNTG